MHARFSTAVRPEGSPNPSTASLSAPPPRRSAPMPSKRSTPANKRTQSVVLIVCITLACVFLTSQMLRSAVNTRKSALVASRVDAKDHMTRRTLSFDACFGMANQRLSILYGVLFAVELGRTVVLPKCTVSSEQAQHAGSNSAASTVVPFSSLYDANVFVQTLASVGVDVLTDEEVAGIVKTEVSLNMLEDPLIDLHTKYGSISNLHISCPLFKLKRNVFRESTMNIAWKSLEAITPNKAHTKLINAYATKLKGLSRSKQFNLLHLRMESDWVEHCKQIKKSKDGHDNCMAHTDDVDKVLLAYNLPISVPLLVSTMWDLTDPARAEAVLARLRKVGYQVFTSREFTEFYSSDREHNALIDYELALRSARFVGNSVSTFSALAILQRRQAKQWAAYYNMGPMPIEAHIPAQLLPWVFAYNNATPDDDYMVKVAVLSAQPYMSILPVCLWAGDTTVEIYQWLVDHGVMMIQHQVSWGDELWVLAEPHAAHNARQSPLYRSQLELTSDFARIDVSILPQLEQYNYILLTGPYIVFTHEVSLSTLNAALPSVINMHVARSDDASIPISDVLLLNLLEARSSYDEFKSFVLNSRHGAMFPGYGAGASGAFAQFYEPYMRMDKLPARIAINAGTNFDSRARILNFEGPKVHDFLHFYRTGSCNWGNACELGLRKSLCPVIKHWQTFMNETEDQLGVSMWYACETLYAPHLFWPKFQPS